MKRVDDFRLRWASMNWCPSWSAAWEWISRRRNWRWKPRASAASATSRTPWCRRSSDRRFNTRYVKDKLKQYKFNVANTDKAVVKFDLGLLEEATALHVGRTMEAKRGDGLIFINCMEKLTMNAPKETCACASRPHWMPASTASPWPPACTWAASA
jgi:nitronate monooxygenase